MYECMKQAREDGCLVMLSGQYGNVTLSYGDYESYLPHLLRTVKLMTLIREMNSLCKRYPVGRKIIIKRLIKAILPNLFEREQSRENDLIVNQEMMKKYKVNKRFRKERINTLNEGWVTMKQVHQYMYMKTALSQIGEIETKLSLATGVIIKDPTRSKQMLLFVMSLPWGQFVRNGQERYLVREYMKDIIPKEILCKTERSKGLQSADFVWRLKRGKAEMIKCIKKAIEEKQYIYLFDKDKVIKLLKAYQDDKIGSYEIRKLLYVKEFDEFVSMFCRKDE